MLDEYRYAYLVGTLIWGVFWLALFYWRKDLRTEMLTVGTGIGIIALFWAPSFFYEYWNPQYIGSFHIEDFLYGFFAGGIVSVIYEEVYGKRFSKKKDHHHAWWLFLAAVIFASAITFQALHFNGMSSIYAALFAFAIAGVSICVFRRDLIQDAIVSGVLFVVVTYVLYLIYLSIYPNIIAAWWNVDHLSGVFISGVPLEELLWAFGMGMAGGPIYEFVSGRRLVQALAR